MTEIDPQTEKALGLLRRDWSPPEHDTEAMLAAFHRRLGEGGGDGGDGGGGGGGGGESIGLAKSITAARISYVAKIVMATTGMTTAGLASVWLVGAAVREPPRDRSSSNAGIVHEPDSVRESAAIASREPPPIPTPIASTLDAPPSQPPRQSPSSPPGSREPAAIDLAAELALIRAAEAAAPSEALERLAEHAERFPSGTLASEREGLWILTSCTLGRTTEAQTRFRRFVVDYPSSLMVERITKACPALDPTTTESLASGDG
jgi:hypothetical protein